MTLAADIGAWRDLGFWHAYYPAIQAQLAADPREILPPPETRFAALARCQPANTRVVILGQDPYPTPGHAHGFAFSVAGDVRPLPRSLINIFKEMQYDLGAYPATGDLRFWADQGVLLINTALSVPKGEANGHKTLGWHRLTQEIIAKTSRRPTAYVLWGKQAQSYEKFIEPGDHLILKTAHPSPLSARRGFFGSAPFSRINAWLAESALPPIDWVGAAAPQQETPR